jgi:predicted restriction endonuclease
MAAEQMSRDELLEFVRQLPEKTPVASRSASDLSAKQSWINWLSNYADFGDHPLRGQRDARFIYNHWWNVPIFIWLAEASGVDQERIQRAAKIAGASGNSTTQAAAIRKILPWNLVAKHLRERKRIEPARELQGDIAHDLAQIRSDKRIKSETTREALINARRGQGEFRADLERRWNGLCAVTGCGISAMLRASHIKPWSKSSNHDRLNPANGILLAAHIDALFDSGLISFSDDGKMIVSAQIADDLRQLQLPERLRRRPTKEERQFLAYHRRHVLVA